MQIRNAQNFLHMSDKIETKRVGYDASCIRREQDHLNRWPLAKEIYRIAVDGPPEWSVRIGIYGEWGMGKSSVLNFIESMALEDGHILFHFNPWQYQSKNELWSSFVRGVYKKVEDELRLTIEGRKKRISKTIGSAVANTLPSIIKAFNEGAGTATESGIGLVKKYLSFSSEDLQELMAVLEGKSILIAVDDLDRVQSELVPEILYALNEIMDVPCFSFICAFDPVVVGKVLGKAHPGHEDGLKFLEKIIDYPRWLPEPTNQQLIRLAESEIQNFCNFVPISEMQQVIPLLPKNPRSVRQFIRVLGLLKPQIERHYPRELHWRVILVANVIKIHLPQHAYALLRDEDLWKSISSDARYQKDKDNNIKTTIEQYLREIHDNYPQNLKLLRQCINRLSEAIEPWVGLDENALKYQFSIAEEPCAVTWKEFDEFYESAGAPDEDKIIEWVSKHSEFIEDSKERIYDEIVNAAISKRSGALSKAADSADKKELESQMQRASKLLKILSIVIRLLRTDEKIPVSKHYEAIVEQIARYYNWKNEDCYVLEREQEEIFLNQLLDPNRSDWMNWLEIIPLYSTYGRHHSESKEWKSFENDLRIKLQQRATLHIIDRIQSEELNCWNLFEQSNFGYQFQSLFLDLNGFLWNRYQNELLEAIGKTGQHMQRNCYHMIYWLMENARISSEMQATAKILLQKEFIGALWNNCVSSELNPRMVGSLRQYRDTLISQYNLELPLPAWWEYVCERLDRDREPKQDHQEEN